MKPVQLAFDFTAAPARRWGRRMLARFAVLASAVTLAACTTGQAEFAALPGETLTQANLIRAQGYCRMRFNDQVDKMAAMYGAEATLIAGQGQLVDDAVACYASQGVRVKGWRQKDGSLTARPFVGSPKIEAGVKSPAAPAKRKVPS